MTLALDDLPRDPEWLLQQLRHMAEVVAAERSRNTALEIERGTVLAELDAARTERAELDSVMNGAFCSATDPPHRFGPLGGYVLHQSTCLLEE